MKKFTSIVLSLILMLLSSVPIYEKADTKIEAEHQSIYSNANIELEETLGGAYLCEATTGKVLYAENEFSAASPASVTKVMTLLLVMEALEAGKYKLDDKVMISANAASMGGSQVFLEEGEEITVEELIKSTVIASGNDASVALAELTAGSEKSFVKLMNKRASELGLKNTSFENTTGLDDTTTDHYSCAADIALMSRELIKHELILKYSSIWQDTIRNGEFTLTNTNRLVRYYEGCNGLKTGSTDKAGYCISVTAKRGNMQLIAVIMGAETRDERNSAARKLLDFGFANYALFERPEEYVEDGVVLFGENDSVPIYSSAFSCVVSKSDISKIEFVYNIPENITAPISEGEVVGELIYKIEGNQIGESKLYAKSDVKRLTYMSVFGKILKRIVCGKF